MIAQKVPKVAKNHENRAKMGPKQRVWAIFGWFFFIPITTKCTKTNMFATRSVRI
jgi:hypothetical protein